MSKEKHLERINELLDTVRAELLYESARMLNSSMVDPYQYNDEEYRLAKIIVTASLHRQSVMFAPIMNEDKKTCNNLKRM